VQFRENLTYSKLLTNMKLKFFQLADVARNDISTQV